MSDFLVFDRVGKTYPGFALKDVSFGVPAGCIMGLVGPNGAGKTTLIRMVMNLVRKDSGSITLDGRDSVRDEAAVKARIGFVPDEPRFFDDATLRAIASATASFFPRWETATFRGLMAEFRLEPRARFGKLSQGQKTQFALALALARGADLLLLDEPTAGLDPLFRRELLGRLSAFLQDEKRSVLFSTHITTDLERIADYVAFIRNGRLVFSLPRDVVRERWRVVRGDRGLLEGEEHRLFAGVRRGEFGMEALTGLGGEAGPAFAGRAVVEPATLEDILVLYGTGGYPLPGGDDSRAPAPSGSRRPGRPGAAERRNA
ncbi:MAG: ABC transporter ATP-binding protein [Acidobacteria bacterium]|nr:ABC transporter ATP-binding protein [Acidobacteriota bacterium]